MSHFSQIKTQIRNLDSLQTALTELGIDWKPGPRIVRAIAVRLVVLRSLLSRTTVAMCGFSWNGKEYELIADLHIEATFVSRWVLRKVTQRYAYQTIVRKQLNKDFKSPSNNK